MRRLPAEIFDVVWKVYLEGKLARLAVHPVANFVVAKALERVSVEQLTMACEEVRSVAEKIISRFRTYVQKKARAENPYRICANRCSQSNGRPRIIVECTRSSCCGGVLKYCYA